MQGFGSEVLFHRGRRVVGFGLGQSSQQQAQQYLTNLQSSYTQQGNTYLLNTAQATSGMNTQGLDFTALVTAVTSGDAAGTTLAADNLLVAYAVAAGVPAAGIAWAAELLIMQGDRKSVV